MTDEHNQTGEHKQIRREEHKHIPKKKFNFQMWSQIATVVLLVIISTQLSSLNSNFAGGEVVKAAAQPAQPAAAAQPRAQPTAPATDMVALIDDDSVKGDPNAPVTIVEFSDFECPFCGRFYSQTLGQIKSQYVDTGKVKIVYRDFPLSFHQQAQKSAEAAECAGEQGKYWEMHDILFEKGVTGGVPSFKQYAADLGLNTGTFNTCLDSGAMASEVAQDMRDGQAAGITGTPGFIINGQKVSGAQPFSAFQQIIEAELAK